MFAADQGVLGLPGRSFRSQESMSLAFERQAGQSARHVGSGVNVDSISKDFWFVGWGVAVDHPLPEIHWAVEKLVANPQ